MNRNYTYTGPSGTFVIGDLVFVRDVPIATDDATIDYLRGTYPVHTWVLTGNDEPSMEEATPKVTANIADRTTATPLEDLTAGLQGVSEAAFRGADAMDHLSDIAESAKATEDKAE